MKQIAWEEKRNRWVKGYDQQMKKQGKKFNKKGSKSFNKGDFQNKNKKKKFK